MTENLLQPISKLSDVSWFPFSDEPLLGKEFLIPSFFDPQILLPEEACDGRWHMFVHSWIGLHHFASDSGIAWEPVSMIEVRASSPFIYLENGTYYLLYEKHDRKVPFFGLEKPDWGGLKDDDTSRIEMCTSTDLVKFSRPVIILDSRQIPFSADYIRRPKVSRPQLIRFNGGYRLYFGASEVKLSDSGQKVTRYFCYADSEKIEGPYTAAPKPVLLPNPNDKYSNLGSGAVRILPGTDGGVSAVQCSAYWSPQEAKTRTAMFILSSDDGVYFRRNSLTPLLVPAERGWAGSYIMSCDVHYKASEDCWYCYFSANADSGLGIKHESVGLLLGKVRS